MLSELEAGKAILEVPIIPAAVVGATGVALGANTDLAIVLGGGASGLAAGSNYLRPRERLGYVVQARAATVCIQREYVDQVELARAYGLLEPYESAPTPTPAPAAETNDQRLAREAADRVALRRWRLRESQGEIILFPTGAVDALPQIRGQVAGVGRITLAATDTVATRLRTRLAGIGDVPNYGSIVTELRQRFEEAQRQAQAANAARVAALHNTLSDQTIRTLAEYSARIAECVATIQ